MKWTSYVEIHHKIIVTLTSVLLTNKIKNTFFNKEIIISHRMNKDLTLPLCEMEIWFHLVS